MTKNPIFGQSESDPNFLFAMNKNSGSNTRFQPPGSQPFKWMTAKRKRSSPKANPKPKQVKITDYWLNPNTETTNRFQELIEEGNEPPKVVEKTPKPPPLFIAGVKSLKPLTDLLKAVAKEEYQIKILGNDEVKLQTKTITDYRLLVTELEKKNTEFHSYKAKQLRSFRTVLRGLHPSVDIAEIKLAIQELNHKVVNIHNIKHRATGNPLPLFYVDLEPQDNNKEIYSVRALLHTKITFEAPHQKRELPQCTKCQRYEHTQKYCNRKPRCVKCAGDHLTKNCQRTTEDDKVKCVLCNGSHPANYKGCKHYKDLQEKKFPQLRNKQIISQKNPPGFAPSSYLPRHPNLSYAQVVNGVNEELFIPSTSSQKYHTTPQTTQQSDDICELKSMMKDLMAQISPLINLLTILVSKMA